MGGLVYLLINRAYYWRQRAPRIAYISRKGVYCCGAFWPWGRWGTRLQGIEWVEGHPCLLRFRFVTINPEGPDYDNTFAVPVPLGHEVEAAHVYRALTGREPRRAPPLRGPER
jgi:hypothetical protein